MLGPVCLVFELGFILSLGICGLGAFGFGVF